MAVAHINIGSNLGDRRALIERAVAIIRAHFPSATLRRSDFIVSAPWGFDSPNQFLNLGIALHLPDPIDPLDLFDLLQQIQRQIDAAPHRTPQGSYADRSIDIDLIAIDQIILDTPRLTLPHPRMHQRPFVLLPLRQLSPSWLHPRLHQTPAQLLAALS